MKIGRLLVVFPLLLACPPLHSEVAVLERSYEDCSVASRGVVPCGLTHPLFFSGKLLFQAPTAGGEARSDYVFEDAYSSEAGDSFFEEYYASLETDDHVLKRLPGHELIYDSTPNTSLTIWAAETGERVANLPLDGYYRGIWWAEDGTTAWAADVPFVATPTTLTLRQHMTEVLLRGLNHPIRTIDFDGQAVRYSVPVWNAGQKAFYVAAAKRSNGYVEATVYKCAGEDGEVLQSMLTPAWFVPDFELQLSERTGKLVALNPTASCYLADMDDISTLREIAPNGCKTAVMTPDGMVLVVGHHENINWFFDLLEDKLILELTGCEPIESMTDDQSDFFGGPYRYSMDHDVLRKRWARSKCLGFFAVSGAQEDRNNDGVVDMGDFLKP